MPKGTIAPVTGPLTLFNTSATEHVMRLLSSCWGMKINQRELLDHREAGNILFQLTSFEGELQQEKLLEYYSP